MSSIPPKKKKFILLNQNINPIKQQPKQPQHRQIKQNAKIIVISRSPLQNNQHNHNQLILNNKVNLLQIKIKHNDNIIMQHRNVLPQQQHNEKPRNINNNSNNQIQVHRKIQSSQGLRQLQQKHLQNNAINNNNPVKSYINTPPKIERKNDANNYVKIFNKNNNGIPKIGHKIKLVSKPINAVAPHFKNKQQFRSLSSYVQDFGKHSEQNVYSPMEDTLDYNVNFYADNDRTISYFAVFDGCGGAQVSSYLKSNFQKILLSHLKHNNFDICPSFKNAFIDAETQLAQSLQSSLVQSESQMQMPLTSPASTAVIILVMNNEIHSINIGDSSSFYVDNNNIVKLSVEHMY